MNWLARWYIHHKERQMKKWILNIGHTINWAVLAAQVFQALPPNPWVMVAQAALAALAPSLGGVGHAMVFGGKQEDSAKH